MRTNEPIQGRIESPSREAPAAPRPLDQELIAALLAEEFPEAASALAGGADPMAELVRLVRLLRQAAKDQDARLVDLLAPSGDALGVHPALMEAAGLRDAGIVLALARRSTPQAMGQAVMEGRGPCLDALIEAGGDAAAGLSYPFAIALLVSDMAMMRRLLPLSAPKEWAHSIHPWSSLEQGFAHASPECLRLALEACDPPACALRKMAAGVVDRRDGGAEALSILMEHAARRESRDIGAACLPTTDGSSSGRRI